MLAGLLASGVLAGCGDDGDAGGTTATSGGSPSTATSTSTSTSDPSTTAPSSTAEPGGPEAPAEVARLVAEAWAAADRGVLAALAERGVLDLLAALDAPDGPWTAAGCEGAAGSSYCRFTAPGASLTLRVANEAARATEATLTATGEAVALWPLTTTAEAEATQAQVDEGHSPWQLEPEAVVLAFAEAELGFASPSIDTSASDGELVRVVAADSAAAGVAVGQPARTGPGGTWAVVAVQSVAR